MVYNTSEYLTKGGSKNDMLSLRLQIYFRPRVTLTFDLLIPKVDRFIVASWIIYVITC